MNIDKIFEKLNVDITSNKSFLIDGPWGIGKTTMVKEYLKNKKYLYLSLFGIKDLKELEDNLFLELKNINTELAKICQFYEPFNIKTNVLKKEIDKVLENPLYVVFDDVEKKSDVLTYKELFGLISSLNDIKNIKIIIICDSTKIGMNNYEIFSNLKELVIDKTYLFSNYSKETLFSILDKLTKLKPKEEIITKEKYENYLISFLDKYKIKNLRTIKKMIIFSGIIINNVDTSNLSKGDIQTLVNISFSVVAEKIDHYNYDREHLLKIIVSEYLTNVIYPISKEELVESIILIYDNPSSLYFNKINQFFINVISCKIEKKNPNLFYLSADKIEKKITKFVKNSVIKYNSKYTLDTWFNQLYDYYYYALLIEKENLLPRDEIIKSIDNYIGALKCEYINLFNLQLRMQHENNKTDESSRIYKILKDKIVYKYFMYYYENVIKTYDEKTYDSKKIADLITFILGSNFKNNDDLDTAISLLRNKNLFIPDLNNEIDEVIWNFVHEIWKGISTSDESQNKRKMLNLLIQVSNDLYQTATPLGKYRISTLNEYYNIL